MARPRRISPNGKLNLRNNAKTNKGRAARNGVPDDESPELSDADFARARPVPEVMPQLLEAAARLRVRGRPKLENKLQQFSLRIEREVLNTFKETGAGWQEHMRETLGKEAKRLAAGQAKRRTKKQA